MIDMISRLRAGHQLFLASLLAILVIACSYADDGVVDREALREPVYRVTKADTTAGTTPEPSKVVDESESSKEHPLDPAMVMARKSLGKIKDDVRDYTCTIIRRERVNGALLDAESISCKIREPHVDDDGNAVPFSVYMKFRKPRAVAGREVIFVDGENNGKLIAHEGGWKGRITPTVYLEPNGALAMRGNRYPITEVGVRRLTEKLIEKGERDRARGMCDVNLLEGVKINGRVCTRLEVIHPQRLPHLDFHLARIYLDDEHGIPVRYEAYDWPLEEGERPPLLEVYTYLDVEMNVGLQNADFDKSVYGF